MRFVLLTHGGFPERAKTAVGLLRYSDVSGHDVAAVLDRELAEGRVSDYVEDVDDAPVVDELGQVDGYDALVIGVAPIGGGFDESWRDDVRDALSRGKDVYSGLHYYLSDDDEFSSLATENGCEIHDLRRPPDYLSVYQGDESVDAEVVLTVGTDCSVGKMTTTLELVKAARERGVDAAFAPTGQTGIMIEGDGIAVDAVKSDYVAGAAERVVLDAADRDGNSHGYDYVFVEGQGSIVHPAYSGVTCGILHGASPDSLVLCHEAGRDEVHGYSQELPDVEEFVDLYERLSRPVSGATVEGISLKTSGSSDGEARDAVEGFEASSGVPTTDPVRFGTSDLLEPLLE